MVVDIKTLRAMVERIGGERRLASILNDFYQRMANDVLIGFFFTGRDIKAIAQKQKQFLMKAWGINRSFKGKTPARAHQHLPPILKGHFDRRLVILKETLQAHALDAGDIKTWVQFEASFRKAVQHK